MKTVLTFDDVRDALNEYHKDPEYVISFMVRSSIYLIKYGSRYPHSNDEMKALIKEAREECKSI